MAKTYRLNPLLRFVNWGATLLLRMGVPIGTTSLLTVRGWKSGQMRTVVVTLIEQDDNRWLVAPYGEVNWVRNVRAAKEAIVTRRRHSEKVQLVELDPGEAAPVLKQYLKKIRVVRPYFDVTPRSPLSAFETEAPQHPVFKIVKTMPGEQ